MSNTIVLKAAQPSTGRIKALDIARGIAILGTLGTNIWIFTHPDGMFGFLLQPVTAGTSSAAETAQLTLMALSQGKFLALLTLLFGMGLAIQHRSAQKRGVRWPGGYLWRAFLLLLDGVINFILIAEFDVLMGYAITGAVVSWMLLTRPRSQHVMILVFGALHVLLISAIVAAVALLPGDAGSAGPVGPTPYATGSFLDLATFRLDNFLAFRAEPVLIGFLSIAMFLLGAHLHRAGIFRPEGAQLRRRLTVIGAVALPVDLALGIFGGTAGLLAERYLIAPLVALGLVGVVGAVCTRQSAPGWAARRLTEVGRTALSCYLLQNLIAGAIFYGWGLGIADELGQWRVGATILGYLAIAALVVLFAHLWLRRFPVGPVEWLWKQGARVVPERGQDSTAGSSHVGYPRTKEHCDLSGSGTPPRRGRSGG